MGSSSDPKPKMVVVGQFAGPHGVRGEFKLRSYTEDPSSLFTYGPLKTKGGLTLTPTLVREAKETLFVATAPEVASREDCDVFKGALLHIPRSVLPSTDDDEFYLDDLVGLKAVDERGAPAGSVKAVVNYGAGDILELMDVPDHKGVVLVPFTKEAVPQVDLVGGQVEVVLPEDEPDEDELS